MQSIMDTVKGECFMCGKVCETQEHHIFGGSNRRMSTEYGMTVYLCPYCHNKCHNGKKSPEYRYKLHVKGQRRFEEYYSTIFGWTKKQARDEFMKAFGRNYV